MTDENGRPEITYKKKVYGKLVQDEDSHWYLVPSDMWSDFHQMQEACLGDTWTEDQENAIERFCEKYDKYRLSGGVQDLLIPMDDR